MRAPVQLRLFGPFEALQPDGTPVEVPGKKLQALIAYLAVDSDRVHRRQQLAALLWGQMGDERARHNLRQALSKIRRVGGGIIAADDDMLRLDESQCQADVREFEQLADRSEPDALARAVALHRGDLLEGLRLDEAPFDDWLRDARTRLRAEASDALGRLADTHAVDGALEEALRLQRQRLTLDPACEPAHRAVIELLARSGRRSEALRAAQHCTELLDRELGVEPSGATRELVARLRQTDLDAHAIPVDTEAGRSANHEPPSVCVVPFDNLSGSADDYFVDGITEDITTALSRFGSLLVIARVAAFASRDRSPTSDRIAQQLRVRFLVRGSVRRAGDRIRISVQLVDTATDATVWAHRFDRELRDVFQVQDELTSVIVATLAGRVEATRLAEARRMAPERLDAYDSVLRGKDHHHRHTASDCQTAIELFERAIERDPHFAPAHAWLACGLGQARAYRPTEDQALIAQAEVAATRARELDNGDAECHRVLASIATIRHDLAGAQTHQERGLALNPNDDRQVCQMGQIHCFRGRHNEAVTWIERAMRLNPYHPESLWLYLGRALFHAGRYEEALAALDRITNPRTAVHVYRVAASVRLASPEAQRHVEALRACDADFAPESFIAAVPYEHERERRALRDALRAADF